MTTISFTDNSFLFAALVNDSQVKLQNMQLSIRLIYHTTARPFCKIKNRQSRGSRSICDRYSASPVFCEKVIQYRMTSAEVIVMDQDLHEIVRHRRLYGEDEPESMNWLPYLKYIARKPRSLRNSGIYDMMPENMRHFMDTCDNADRGKILKTLSELTDRTGFESALRTVDEAIHLQVKDPDSLKNLYRRLYSDVPALPPLESSMDTPLGKIIPLRNDFSSYDAALRGGAQHG